MPPSHHSHSSHSSHSHSHSHSSHSSHSHSSHSSYSSGRSRSYSSRPVRTRTNQPTGWSTAKHGNCIRYDFRDHDYIYYPHSWTDENGNVFREGYYDENGIHYTNIAASNVQTTLTCQFCGTKSIWQWQEGTIPVCSNCGGQIKIDKIDAAVNNVSGIRSSKKPLMTALLIGLGIYVGIPLTFTLFYVVIILFSAFFKLLPIHKNSSTDQTTRTAVVETQKMPSSVYVKEINRTCYLDGEDYYDEKTQCWFWYNTDVVPGQWQYWYEGISSDYGDYGWMEYDDDKGIWYIEFSDGKWKKLPDKYDTTDLWHFENKNVNELY